MTDPARFIHLRVHSAYSLLEGAIHIKELVKLSVKHDMPALAVTDSGNLFGSLEFSQVAAEAGIQPIIGCIGFFKPDDEADPRTHSTMVPDELVLLAKDETGYRNLLQLVSKSFLSPAGEPSPLLAYNDLDGYSKGLIALSGGVRGRLGRLIAGGREQAARVFLERLKEWFDDRLYIELQRHHMDEERRCEKGLIQLAMAHNIPLVATNDVYFSDAEMFDAHDALICVAGGRYVSEQSRRRLTTEHRFKSQEEMCSLFSDIPEAVQNTLIIAQRCAVMATAHKPILPRFTAIDDSMQGLSEADALRKASREGLEQRLRDHIFTADMDVAQCQEAGKPYRERLEYELDVIIGMDFPGYFLIVSDFIKWSKAQNIPVGPGRGSGAGSVVAWALLITDLNPLKYGLLFERFLNPERISMPDFDIDFCQDRRDEVIAYVQQRYGSDRVAQIITFGKLQARAVLRDVGRVLQIPYGQVDRICKLVPNNPAAPVTLQQAINMEPLLRQAIREDEMVERLADIALKLEGLYRHASTHAAGVVIADRPLQELVPLYRDEKSTMPVVQYSMKYAESAGLVKFDFLGLKTLTVLQKSVELVQKRNIDIDLLKLPEGDVKTYAMLSQGDTVGIFQFESAGMRDSLKRLKPDCLEDLIALGALYRPGPMDNIPMYVARKHGVEKPEYLHPKLAEILKETYGVIIYQEQVMQIAQLLAGYSLGEADLLRRAMGKKIRSEMEAQREIFVSRAIGRGVVEEQARSIFDLIAKFAEYGFNKSHAAAYAVISYQTAYMKANFPVEFLAASMTYDMHNTDKLSVFRQEAQRYNIALLPPDVNASEVYFSVENGAIRYALSAIRNVGAQAMAALVDERNKNGPYKNLFDLAERLDSHIINRRQLEHLIKAGAFDSIHPNRQQAFNAIDFMIGHSNALTRERQSAQSSLFGGPDAKSPAPLPALASCDDWPPLERLQHEFSAIGFYLSSHPLQGYGRALKRMHVLSCNQFGERLSSNYTQVKVAGMVTGAKFKVSPKGRFAFIQMSDTTGIYEISVFDEKLLNTHRTLLDTGTLLLVAADAKADETGARLIAQAIFPLEEEIVKNQRRGVNGEVRIIMQNTMPLPTLKQIIGDMAPQGMKITLVMQMGEASEAEVELPGCYALTPALLSQISGLSGVVNAEEVG